ncbi:MAG: hypothetical protein WD734_05120 [Dehalococcoidia bacterium]
MHGLRYEYQDRVNFVVLDYDREEDLALARELQVARHPAYAVVEADGGPTSVVERRFGPQPEPALRSLLESLAAE